MLEYVKTLGLTVENVVERVLALYGNSDHAAHIHYECDVITFRRYPTDHHGDIAQAQHLLKDAWLAYHDKKIKDAADMIRALPVVKVHSIRFKSDDIVYLEDIPWDRFPMSVIALLAKLRPENKKPLEISAKNDRFFLVDGMVRYHVDRHTYEKCKCIRTSCNKKTFANIISVLNLQCDHLSVKELQRIAVFMENIYQKELDVMII